MEIIGLSGWKRSGKDMLAEYLIEKHGFKRIAFADPLKQDVMREAGLSEDQVYRQDLKEKPLLQYPLRPQDKFSEHIAHVIWPECRFADGSQPVWKPFHYTTGYVAAKNDGVLEPLYYTPRALLILKGSVQRSWDSNYWVKKALAGLDPAGKYVLADLRYKSEIEAIFHHLRDAAQHKFVPIRINRFETCTSADASERDLDTYPFWHIIKNGGPKEEAYAQMDKILQEIRS